MKNFKVGKKLAVVFGIILALFIGTASIGGACLTKVSSSMSNFYNNQFYVVSAQYSMRVSLQATVRYLLWACTTDSDAETAEYVAKAQEQLKIMNDGLPILQEKFQGDPSLITDFQKLVEKAGPVRQNLIAMAESNHVDESIAMFNNEYVPLITEAQEKLIQIGDFASNRSAEVYKSSQRLEKEALILLVSAVIVSLALIIFFCIYITRGITHPIKEIEAAAKGIAAGKLDSEISYHSRDELGGLAENLRAPIDSMDIIIKDIAFMTSELAKGNFTVVSEAEDAYIGSFNPIILSMRDMKKHLSSAMRQISDAADQVSAGSDQISSTAQSLSQGASEQASSVEELSASINEISVQVEKTAENAKTASLKADVVGESIMKSNQEMQQMIKAMANINDTSGEIGKIIKTIEDIAFQTNILALNAAVEAARAGAAGKGFAVVADEVRNLASKSADASKNTSQLIENSLKAVEEGSRIADSTAQSLLATVEGVKSVAATISDISTASNAQADSILSITQNMEQISNVVQTNSATSEESAAASEELAGQSRLLKDLVNMFKLSEQTPSDGWTESPSSGNRNGSPAGNIRPLSLGTTSTDKY